eukprot:15025751-Alexandrium_andersonii.AAC.1
MCVECQAHLLLPPNGEQWGHQGASDFVQEALRGPEQPPPVQAPAGAADVEDQFRNSARP